MAMNRSGHQPGGGIASRVVTERPVRAGSGARAAGPGGVGQLGQSQGSHVTRGEESTYRGDALFTGRGLNPTPYGNEVAANTVCGVGGSRTIYSAGSQSGSSGHGSANPGNPRPTPSRHIIESYGPDYRRPGNPSRDDRDADF
jgi:hypothetical protein